MKANNLFELIQMIINSDATLRGNGADQVTDWISSYSSIEAATLASVLSITAACEKNHNALEAQLHAILELTSTGQVNTEHISHLREIHRGRLPTELQEYITDLLDERPH